jgi:hypothetical protein
MTPELEPLVRAILADLDSDDCDIAWILDAVRDTCPDAPYDLLEQTVLRIVGELVGRGLAEAHPFCEPPNAVTSAEGVVDEVRRGWEALGDQLSMGDVGYLRITPAGRAEARSSSRV